MKVPKKIRKFCPKCKQYQEMTVSLNRQQGKNKVHPMSRGSRSRMKKRGLDRGFGNKGSVSRGAMSKWKRYNVKKSKKVNLLLKCSVCHKSMQLVGSRAKKVEVAHT